MDDFEANANLTVVGSYSTGAINLNTAKRVCTAGRIGFNNEDQDQLWVQLAAYEYKGEQLWSVALLGNSTPR